MKVLITAASRHGATAAIAAEIGRELRLSGHDVTVTEPDRVADLVGVDAVVLGSAVYHDRWLPSALRFADRLAEDLRARPLWLFSSGPVGEPSLTVAVPKGVDRVTRRSGARGHVVFGGRLDDVLLDRRERRGARRLHAVDGDHREWPAIRSWAAGLAAYLHQPDDHPDVILR